MPRSSSTATTGQARSAANTIRILVATDNHVGYAERDPVRGDDSYTTFNEIMELAKERDVDMVFLGGDLFHDNKPSRKAMYQVMRSIRLNCLGEKPCELQVLGDQSIIFDDKTISHVNYEDPDINVAIPVFSIHGNHDDPTGEGHLCALDILQVSGLVNYIGRIPANDDITVNPLLLQKGTTLLALYGLSNVRDERLFNTFREGKVKFRRPAERMDAWFNLLAVHQNHVVRPGGAYLPENFLQSFFDMVIWGHEHECLIDPKYNPEQGFYVVQPGSSVATSLSEGETVPKHVAILSVTGKEFNLEKIRLRTVRPFIMREIVLADVPRFARKASDKGKEAVINYLREQVEEAIEEANEQWLESQAADSQDLTPPLPLIRLRVEHSGPFEVENPQRFSNKFVGKVANTTDVVQFYRKKKLGTTKRTSTTIIDDAEIEESEDSQDRVIRVEALVKEFLSAQTLSVLEENGLGEAIESFVDKDDKRALADFIDDTLKEHVDNLVKSEVDEKNLDEEISKLKDKLSAKITERQKTTRAGHTDDDLFASAPDRAISGRDVAQLTGARRARGRGDDDDDDMMSIDSGPRQQGTKRSAAQSLSDDDDVMGDLPATSKKRRTAAAKPTKATPASRSRQSSVSSNPPPVRKTPARNAASRAKKNIVIDEDDDVQDNESIIELSDEDEDDFQTPPPRPTKAKPPASKSMKQTTLSFGTSGSRTSGRKR